jgi:hypothetical protein
MLTRSQNQALYPVLQHYTGSQITSIFTEGEDLLFNTLWGEKGRLLEDHNGNWNILINHEVVESIEKIVFDALVKPSKKNTVEEYLYQLNDLVLRPSLKYRSKTLVCEIIKFLEDYILTSNFAPKKPISIGPFAIFSYKGKRMVNCLN